jgi:TPR repeat protein
MHASAERKIVGVAAAVLALSIAVIVGLTLASPILMAQKTEAPPRPTLSKTQIADMLKEAEAALEWNNEDYPKAFKIYTTLAEQGEPRGQYHLGALYADGKAVPQDYETAAMWYRRAADQGNASAMDALGGAIFMGEGVARDLDEMARLYQKAASLGHTGAMFHLAVCYSEGWGVNRDRVMAYVWYSAVIKGEGSGSTFADWAAGNRKDEWDHMTPQERTQAKDKVAALQLD